VAFSEAILSLALFGKLLAAPFLVEPYRLWKRGCIATLLVAHQSSLTDMSLEN